MSKPIKLNQDLEIPFKDKMEKAIKALIKESDDVLISSNGGKIHRDPPHHIVKVEHDFAPGIYMRRMLMQKETLVFGAIHKREHAWFLLEGEITVTDDSGQFKFKAPHFHISEAGTQRIIFANKKSVFQNVFKNPKELRDLDKIEDYHYCTTQKAYQEYINNKNK